MIQYMVRIQVVEMERREGIAEIETVRVIPETVISSIDCTDTVTLKIGKAVERARQLADICKAKE